ncbi:rhodanese-like domain-containing protein [Antarcticibacterium arcticum]|nr:rhodanese-like domain-containing protein [Antarcticibacterium arcticum]
MKRNLMYLLVAIFSFNFISCNSKEDKREVTVIKVDEAKTILAEDPNVIILDVRTPEEFQEGHIEGAVLINFFDDNFEQQVAMLDKDKPVVIYCRSGNRSNKAGKILTDLGFSEIYDMEDGYVGWE